MADLCMHFNAVLQSPLQLPPHWLHSQDPTAQLNPRQSIKRQCTAQTCPWLSQASTPSNAQHQPASRHPIACRPWPPSATHLGCPSIIDIAQHVHFITTAGPNTIPVPTHSAAATHEIPHTTSITLHCTAGAAVPGRHTRCCHCRPAAMKQANSPRSQCMQWASTKAPPNSIEANPIPSMLRPVPKT